MKTLLCIITILVASQFADAQWIKRLVNTTASLRGLSVVNTKIVWASGTGGTVIKTVDGGATWKVITIAGAEKLDFRDVEAFDAKAAYVLSIGNGEDSRIYKTVDGGETWKLQFKNTNAKAFFDAIACWDKVNCIAMSDPVDGRYLLISTNDGGETWKPIASNEMPAAKDGEAAFAASGTCLITQGKNNTFIVSGGNDARVFRSNDRGKTWSVSETPMVKGTSGSGIFSIAMFDDKNGIVVGGNYEKPEERNNTFAMTSDGGTNWSPGARLRGYRSGVAYLEKQTIVAVGTNGTDISYDRSLLWENIGSESLNAVAAKGKNAVWAVGPSGIVMRLNPSSLINQYADLDLKKLDYPHLVNVSSLELSHREINSSCPSSDAECSNKSKITVRAVGPDFDSPHEYIYTVTAGKIVGDGRTVEWDLSNVKPGKHTITAGISIPYFHGTRWGVFGRTKTHAVVIK